MDNEEFYELAPPKASSLIQSLRAFGYDASSAIADLIDNSISARANRVWIEFEWGAGQPWIALVDDGCGMSEKELLNAMTLGSKNPLEMRDEKDLGRFGLGLKTASFSQCKRVTVISKKIDGPVNLRCWDLDIVEEANDWKLLKKGSQLAECLLKDRLRNLESGTIVLWENLDQIIPQTEICDELFQNEFIECAKSVKDHVGITFSSYMSGSRKRKFYMNEREIEAWDPFLLRNESTTSMPEEYLYCNEKSVSITPYILPHQNKLSKDEFEKAASKSGWNDLQGFYVYRNNRLLVKGNWLLPKMQKKEQYKLARIRIDIGNDFDKEWSIDVKKSVAVPPVALQAEIKRIAIAAQRESSRIYRHRGKRLARSTKENQSFIWSQNVRKGKVGYSINRNHIIIKNLLDSSKGQEVKELLRLIEETVPVPMIISDYSDRPDEMLKPYEGIREENIFKMMNELYEKYCANGYESEDAISAIASIEPFIYHIELVEVFRERIEQA